MQCVPGSTPTIGERMSPPAYVLHPEDSLTLARETMHAHAVRHLPVVEDEQLVGIITLSDLYAAEAILNADPDDTPVDALMARELYAVPPHTPLREVAAEMAARHLGSVMVVEGSRLVGLFTASDACRELARALAESTEESGQG